MNTIGVVALSLLAGIFLVILVGGLATLIVLHLRVQKSHAGLVEAMAVFTAKQESSIGRTLEGLEKIVESARSSFGGIRQDIKTSQDAQGKLLTKSLKDHEAVFSEKVGAINGQVLEQASIRAMRALDGLNQLTNTLRNLLHSHEMRPGTELGPEEYGPSDELFVKQGDTARMDEIVNEAESATAYGAQFEEGLPVVRTEL